MLVEAKVSRSDLYNNHFSNRQITTKSQKSVNTSLLVLLGDELSNIYLAEKGALHS